MQARTYQTEWMHYNVDAIIQQLKFNEQRQNACRQNLKFTDGRLKLTTNPHALNHGTIVGRTTKTKNQKQNKKSLILSRSYTESRTLLTKYKTKVKVWCYATGHSHPEHCMQPRCVTHTGNETKRNLLKSKKKG